MKVKGKEYQAPKIEPDTWLILTGHIQVYGNAMVRKWLKCSISTGFHKWVAVIPICIYF